MHIGLVPDEERLQTSCQKLSSISCPWTIDVFPCAIIFSKLATRFSNTVTYSRDTGVRFESNSRYSHLTPAETHLLQAAVREHLIFRVWQRLHLFLFNIDNSPRSKYIRDLLVRSRKHFQWVVRGMSTQVVDEGVVSVVRWWAFTAMNEKRNWDPDCVASQPWTTREPSLSRILACNRTITAHSPLMHDGLRLRQPGSRFRTLGPLSCNKCLAKLYVVLDGTTVNCWQ